MARWVSRSWWNAVCAAGKSSFVWICASGFLIVALRAPSSVSVDLLPGNVVV